jgi:hypothetical protein
MQRLEFSCAVRHIYIYIYVVSRLRVKSPYSLIKSTVEILNTLFLLAHITLFPLSLSLSPSHSLYLCRLLYQSAGYKVWE